MGLIALKHDLNGPNDGSSVQTLTVSIPSSLRSRFLLYGPRATTAGARTPAAGGLLDYLATWRVPHSYFTQFYVASVLSSAFWAVQLVYRGALFQAIASRISQEHLQQSMSLTQLIVCWVLLAIQGIRRLWESYIFAKPSSSQMWVVHWVLGIGFYLAAAVAIWIEGTGMHNLDNCFCHCSYDMVSLLGSLLSQELTIDDLKITNAPSLRTFLCVPLFLFASGLQHDCHHYLFSLKKYTVPDHPIFRGVVCPHYGTECLIYLSLALVAAPPDQVANKTMLACLAFVAINLGITARTTKQWYQDKFGQESVQDWWLMIPWIY